MKNKINLLQCKRNIIIIISTLLILIILWSIISFSSKKLVCKSSLGNITIVYNDETITGYTSNKIYYNMELQKLLVQKIGINDYLKQFKIWFSTNTSGTCT